MRNNLFAFLQKKILLFAMLFLLPVTFMYAQKQQGVKGKYNVLFIVSDDLRPELGAYGSPALTPNIDRIAEKGMRFDNAYAQYPVCNPSRTSFLTGLYPTQTGVINNNDYFRRINLQWVTLPEYFRKNGYVTLRSGKIFHGGIDDEPSWTEGGTPTDPEITERGKTPAGNVQADKSGVSPAEQPLTKSAASDRIIVLSGDGASHGDYKSATRAIEMMEQHKKNRFFLAVGFVKPHSPPTAPQKFFDLYKVGQMKLPVDFDTVPRAPEGFPAISISNPNSDLFINRTSSPDLSREMKRAYFASTSFMDAQVGRVLDALQKNNLQDNTIIVFFGDHGYHLGEKGKWSKAYSLYELGLRVPLLIAVPGSQKQSCAAVVELLDLYPTLAALCGLPGPENIAGDDFSALLKDPLMAWDKPAYSVTQVKNKMGRSVRTARWHYVEWDHDSAGNMLFEHPKDPHELNNLAHNAAYAQVVTEMKALLKQMPEK